MDESDYSREESGSYIEGFRVYSTLENLFQLQLSRFIADVNFIDPSTQEPKLGAVSYTVNGVEGTTYFRFSVDDVMYWSKPLEAQSIVYLTSSTVPKKGKLQM